MAKTKQKNKKTEAGKPEQASGDELLQQGCSAFRDALKQQSGLFGSYTLDPFNMAQTYMDAMFSLWRDPSSLFQAQKNFIGDSIRLWQYTSDRLMGMDSDPVIRPKSGDNRWRDEDWNNNLLFDYIKQSYLLAAKCIEDTVDGVDDLPQTDTKKLTFFTKQYLDALSPTNFPATNPSVLKETIEQQGNNLVAGLQNFVRDMENSDGGLRIAMTDPEAFTLGNNVATSPGKVIYQNRLMQLIQYSPSTSQVYRLPLLIIPPWINKYYILDLQPKNSMIKWLVDQGHTVFIVSWINPDSSYAETGFDDYMTDGILEATARVLEATGEDRLNIVGYCIGGTLLAATLAYLAVQGDTRINSASFFTALIDFSEPGDITVFIDDVQYGNLMETIKEKGYHAGKNMAQAFNMLRSNDLIWSFYINNYLLGKDPMVFDLLYWNSDSTNLAAAMFDFYIRNMYIENNLPRPGGITIRDVPIDLGRVKTPCYFISTHDDHIAPWHSTYRGARLFSGPVRYVLGGSGHIAGIVNPPAANKYCYWTGPDIHALDADDWFRKTTKHEGSWWNDWHQWLTAGNDEQTAARMPGEGPLRAIEDAPGSYVMKRI